MQRWLKLGAAAMTVVALLAACGDGKEDGTPADTSIAFFSDRDTNFAVYVMKGDGSEQVRLTSGQAQDYWPSWSPDGSKIAFTSERDGNREVYVMQADGSDQTNLTNSPARDSWSAWSPDGSKIAFVSNSDRSDDVYVMNADGSGPVKLTTDPGADLAPVWSPDGSKITFISVREKGDQEIYVMNADGSGQTNLTNDPAWEYWSALIFVSPEEGGPAVGGIAQLPEVASDFGWPAGAYAALAGGIAAAVLALSGGAWYARRRWVK